MPKKGLFVVSLIALSMLFLVLLGLHRPVAPGDFSSLGSLKDLQESEELPTGKADKAKVNASSGQERPAQERISPSRLSSTELRETKPFIDTDQTLLEELFLEGRVVDHISREPLRGVQIVLGFANRRANPELPPVFSDEAGYYRIPLPEGTHPFEARADASLRMFITAYHQDYLEIKYHLQHWAGGSFQGPVITMERLKPTEWKVVDQWGQAVQGATIRIRHLHDLLATYQSGDDGRFQVAPHSRTRREESRLSVEKAGFAVQSKRLIGGEPLDDNYEVKLNRGHEVFGRILDEAGLPLAGVEICFKGKVPQSLSIQTKIDGSFLTRLPDGNYHYWITLDGYEFVVEPIELDQPLDLGTILLKKHPLSGKIINEQGNPISGAAVFFLPVDVYGELREATVFSRADGGFHLDHHYSSLMVIHEKYGTTYFRVPDGAEYLELVLESPVELGFQVSNNQNDPITGAEIQLSGDMPRYKYAVSNENGACVLSKLQRGKYRLRIDANSYISQILEIEVYESDTINLKLKEAASLEGTVLSAEGTPVRDVKIVFSSGQKARTVYSHGAGYYHMDGLEPGEYWVTFESRDQDLFREGIYDLREGRSRLDIQLQEPSFSTVLKAATIFLYMSLNGY